MPTTAISIGTNGVPHAIGACLCVCSVSHVRYAAACCCAGLITFGGGHLPNGATEPMPCIDVCGRAGEETYTTFNEGYDAFGVDGVIAPFWNDINPCVADNICGADDQP